LHPITDCLFYWSDATRPVARREGATLDIPLRRSAALGNFY
jgi:hypothetical protein